MAIGKKVDFLLGEVDRCLDIDPQRDQCFSQAVHTFGELPLQRAQGVACCLTGTGFDQVGNRFGLGQVELVVEERPLTELSRAGQTATHLHAALQ
ncbi:hypothetical protein D3C81_1321420 [compost metagenome]